LAQALEIDEASLQDTVGITEEKEAASDETTTVMNEEQAEVNYSLIKIINLSSLLFTLLPPLNIFVPLMLMFGLKQRNSLVRQIISIQMIWTVMAPIVFMLGIFLKFGKQFTLILMIIIVLSNVFIILRNAAEIDRNKKLYFRLKFSMI
jgi:cbb3-type cytochrome oxidase subunit 3